MSTLRAVVPFAALHLVFPCAAWAGITSTPLSAPSPLEDLAFEKLSPEQSGVDFRNPLLPDHPQNYLYYSGFACGAVCIGDVNLDGFPDLFFVSGPEDNGLYLQDPKQPLRFHRKNGVGVDGDGRWGSGAVFVDIDADGDLDIYVCNYDSPNQLYINHVVPDGVVRFTEEAAAYGLDFSGASQMAAFADFDRDGDLDVYVLTNRFYRPGGRPETPPFKIVDGKPVVLPDFQRYYHLRQRGPNDFEMDSYGQPDVLFRNDGQREGYRVFTDVTEAAGISGIGHGLSVTWWDYNQDGFPDLYIGNDFTDPDRLYRNKGDGTFRECLAEVMPYCTWSSMGADSGDLNNDGWPDFISADMAATTHYKAKINMGDMGQHRWLMENGWPRQTMRNTVFINSQGGMFMETAYLSGLAASDWTWAVQIADFDADGREDVFLSNGMARNFSDADIPFGARELIGKSEWDLYRDTPPMLERNLAFRNEGELLFSDRSASWGLDDEGMSYAAATGDLDNDGLPDLVVANLDDAVSIYRNRAAPAGAQRMALQLRMPGGNPHAFGAEIVAETDRGLRLYRYHNPHTGFLSSNDPRIQLGLGEARTLRSLTVRWPDGCRQEFRDLPAGYLHTLTYEAQNGRRASPDPDPDPERLFEIDLALSTLVSHRESPFNDYASQPLLPGKLSQLGPGLAVADVNADGVDDIWMGGASSQSGTLLLSAPSGHQVAPGPWEADAGCEDMGALWFDADGDGRLDLFVASGTNEFRAGTPPQRNRLYRQVDPGRFERVPDGALPDTAAFTSCLAAADFDGDGDLDLFLGTRCIPGRYPAAADSFLWENVSSVGTIRFRESAAAPQLKGVGLVTGAIFTDVNGDGWLDLLVVREWGSPVYLENVEGRFRDRSEEAGISRLSGWWNSICRGDFDEDGDIDYALGNTGLNTKYGSPDSTKPLVLFSGDMDGAGEIQLVEAKFGKEGLLPIRGRSCSSAAMPFIAGKFSSYRSFASAGLAEIYSERRLEEADRFEAVELRSGLLLNESTGGSALLHWKPLPVPAQASPVFGCVAADVDADGHLDLVLAQNLFTREPETGLWRGSPGAVLIGDGSGEFRPVPAGLSGFSVPGDGKGLASGRFSGTGARLSVAVAQNNGPLLVYAVTSSAGAKGDETAGWVEYPPGTRLVFDRAAGKRFAFEFAAGEGYLSQSANRALLPAGFHPAEAAVLKPNASPEN
ncbi:MAG TPA: VCBS repeat-containing protein [Verrucomicrobiales bacterium]|nr:VCBS repeat-containing protein [Verrucomicrobiales bacterium]